MKLTAKQEAYAQTVVKNGGKKSDAYKAHYSTSGMSSAAVSVEADKLYNHPKVSLRIKELQESAKKVAEKKFEWSVEDRMKMLFDIAVTCSMSQGEQEDGSLKLVNPTAAISAIDQMNKMTGDHAAVKTKNEHSGEMTVKRSKEEIEAQLLALGIDPAKL